MPGRFQRANLVPEGFVVVSVDSVGENFHILLRSRCSVGTCPDCGRPSRRVQSRYVRRPSDLPLSGRRVILLIEARRFWCDVCNKRICPSALGIVIPVFCPPSALVPVARITV
ncbi:MAG: hypothetical protein B7Y74_05190 [Novosphingobium sp. 35-62-5]|nr:MAG: hypothetical protein B7Y74_05190 [Novosphingobium sp. 35-62-5]